MSTERTRTTITLTSDRAHRCAIQTTGEHSGGVYLSKTAADAWGAYLEPGEFCQDRAAYRAGMRREIEAWARENGLLSVTIYAPEPGSSTCYPIDQIELAPEPEPS